MKIFGLKFCTFLLLLSLSSQAQQPFLSKKINIGENSLEVLYGDSVIYLTVDQLADFDEDEPFSSYNVLVKWNGKYIKKNRVIMINGERKKVSFSSSQSDLLALLPPSDFNPSGSFAAKQVGQAVILVEFENHAIEIPIRIKHVDLEADFGETAIEQMLGTPDRTSGGFVKYGKQKMFDGINYDATDLIRGLAVKHWFYNEYPGLCISLSPVDSKDHLSLKQAGWIFLSEELIKVM